MYKKFSWVCCYYILCTYVCVCVYVYVPLIHHQLTYWFFTHLYVWNNMERYLLMKILKMKYLCLIKYRVDYLNFIKWYNVYKIEHTHTHTYKIFCHENFIWNRKHIDIYALFPMKCMTWKKISLHWINCYFFFWTQIKLVGLTTTTKISMFFFCCW